MLADAREVPEGTVVETDVCVVGAGAAGITLACEFAGAPFRVCLLESGGLEYDDDTQDLYRGENIGRHYLDLDACRLRYFGGTTNHWEGWCRPLEPIDFEQRRWVPYSGWPFDYRELEPFYHRAQHILQLGPYGYDAPFLKTHNPGISLLDTERVTIRACQFSPPTRFGEVYRSEIKSAGNQSAYLHANVVNIETNDTARQVTRLHVATLGGNQFGVAARYVILATGGIENPRLLLASDNVQSVGLGNQHDLVGRFFMDHLEPSSGLFLLSDLKHPIWEFFTPYWEHEQDDERTPLPLLYLHELMQKQEKILNCAIRLDLELQWELPEGWAALKRLLLPALAGQMPDHFVSNLLTVISDLDGVASRAFEKFSGNELAHRRRAAGRSLTGIARVQNYVQQAPNPDSRVTLSEDRDALGMPRPVLDLRFSEIDKHSIRRTQEIMAQELGRLGLGRMKIEFSKDGESWPPEFYYGKHHMGTTRMSTDPKRGVVNADCRVHGIGNLYIAGSSVFPTSGSATPTLTIVALALRLADHIKGIMA